MHGRVKVRTSEDEKARKLKERNEKVKIFQHAMHKIMTKRKNGELDNELLTIIGQVLHSNPDIYTLWNIRREILTVCLKDTENGHNLSKIFDDELGLTEYCLKVNPKSYCAWHQREWVLLTRSDPDWTKELMLCDKYLKLDERNFHTWDYRRFVVSKSNTSLKDEFNYTTEKLHDNFSNYSAWHYRSKMLVALYPDLESGRPIEDSHHKHELELVINAAFTDPDDTSAWFYQRWLLGAVKETKQLVVCTVSSKNMCFAFNESVTKSFVEETTKVFINSKAVCGQWRSCANKEYDTVWILETDAAVTDGLDIKITFTKDNGDIQEMQCAEQTPSKYVALFPVAFQKQYSKPVVEELVKQLDSCRQLLELEPDNRWTLLTTTFFLYCIDSKQHHGEVISNLKNLKDLDKLRSGYYNDLITKWSLENQILADYAAKEDNMKIKFKDTISSLPHLQYYSFCDNVDLSNQKLNNQVVPSLIVLQNCKVLNLEGNNITTLKHFPELQLEELNIRGNEGLQADEIELFKSKVNFKVIC